MKVGEQQHGEVLVLRPQGAMAGVDAEYLGTHIERVLHDKRGPIVLDVSSVPFVDSLGLEVLLDATEHLIRTGQALKICCASAVLREALELTELAPMFEQFDDVEAALGSFA